MALLIFISQLSSLLLIFFCSSISFCVQSKFSFWVTGYSLVYLSHHPISCLLPQNVPSVECFSTLHLHFPPLVHHFPFNIVLKKRPYVYNPHSLSWESLPNAVWRYWSSSHKSYISLHIKSKTSLRSRETPSTWEGETISGWSEMPFCGSTIRRVPHAWDS